MKGELSESDNQVLVSLEEGSRLPSITDRRAILSCRIEWKFLDAFHGWLMDMCRTCSCWLSTDNARSTGKSLLLAWWIEQNGKEREVKESSNGGVGSVYRHGKSRPLPTQCLILTRTPTPHQPIGDPAAWQPAQTNQSCALQFCHVGWHSQSKCDMINKGYRLITFECVIYALINGFMTTERFDV